MFILYLYESLLIFDNYTLTPCKWFKNLLNSVIMTIKMTLLLWLSTLKCSLVQQPVIKYLHSCGLVWPSLYIHYASMTFSVYNLSPSPDFRLFLFFASLRPEGLPRWHAGKESACKCEKPGFDPLVGKIPWRREWHSTPGFLPGKPRGQRSLVGYSRWSCRIRYDEQLTNTCLHPSGHGEICNINVHKLVCPNWYLQRKF